MRRLSLLHRPQTRSTNQPLDSRQDGGHRQSRFGVIATPSNAPGVNSSLTNVKSDSSTLVARAFSSPRHNPVLPGYGEPITDLAAIFA